MAKLYKSSDVSIGHKTSVVDGAVRLEGGRNLGSLPTLYSDCNSFVSPVNLWFVHLAAVRRLSNLSSYSRALLRYWRFLEKEGLSWDDFPPVKSQKPTYRFRNEELLANVKAGQLAYSTANLYINHVVQFYIWAIKEKLLPLTATHKPFEIEFVSANSSNPISHMLPSFSVQTSDLRIRVPKDACTGKKRPLSPLSKSSLRTLAQELSETSIEMRLIVLLSIQCGLRKIEATSFTVTGLNECYLKSEDALYYEVLIGPHNGIPTKNGKQRIIQIPIALMGLLNDYLVSNRRIERLRKFHVNKVNATEDQAGRNQNTSKATYGFEPIFLTQTGLPYNSSSVGTRFGELRKNIRAQGNNFNYKFHDLRSSYATYRLKSLLDAGVSSVDSLSLIMQWMGHSNESTTWEYLTYLSHKKLLKDKISLLDTILHEALKGESNGS